MIKVAVTQRVAVIPDYNERRDCLDQQWCRFLSACGLTPLLLPNIANLAISLCSDESISGLVLTGGNDLSALGGDAPERDATEHALLQMAEARSLPVLGVCRGMQMLQQRWGIPLRPVEGHVARRQVIRINGERAEVNSFHRFAALESRPPLQTWAISEDGVVKAVRHETQPITGIMWHPERREQFSDADIRLFQGVFGVKTCVP
jgi:putative glutamine amidotransferase